jgi:hypothetical protein
MVSDIILSGDEILCVGKVKTDVIENAQTLKTNSIENEGALKTKGIENEGALKTKGIENEGALKTKGIENEGALKTKGIENEGEIKTQTLNGKNMLEIGHWRSGEAIGIILGFADEKKINIVRKINGSTVSSSLSISDDKELVLKSPGGIVIGGSGLRIGDGSGLRIGDFEITPGESKLLDNKIVNGLKIKHSKSTCSLLLTNDAIILDYITFVNMGNNLVPFPGQINLIKDINDLKVRVTKLEH